MTRFAEAELDLPDFVGWPNFPFGGDLHVNEVVDPLPEEWVRNGDPEGPPCHCVGGEDVGEPIWSNDRWVVRPISFAGEIAPFPAYMLGTVEHLDVGDLDDEMAAELGLITVRLDRAISSLDSVGRTHFNRWGDLGAHLHIWFLGRPVGAMQFAGFSLPMWGFTLPPMSEQGLAANNDAIAASLAKQSA